MTRRQLLQFGFASLFTIDAAAQEKTATVTLTIEGMT